MSTSASPLPTATVRTNRLGLVSLILALIGLGLAFAGPVALLAWLFTLPALVLGIVGATRKNRQKPLALAGIILSTRSSGDHPKHGRICSQHCDHLGIRHRSVRPRRCESLGNRFHVATSHVVKLRCLSRHSHTGAGGTRCVRHRPHCGHVDTHHRRLYRRVCRRFRQSRHSGQWLHLRQSVAGAGDTTSRSCT